LPPTPHKKHGTKMSYQALVIRGPKSASEDNLEVQTRCKPAELDSSAVLVRVRAAGVCHTDVHLWHGYYKVRACNFLLVAFMWLFYLLALKYQLNYVILYNIFSRMAADIEAPEKKHMAHF